MTLLSYEIFQTIIEQGSFVKAASILHLTPSAVSHSISSLESEVGFPLFIRNKNGVKLTNYGEQILPYFQQVIRSNQNVLQKISEMNGLSVGNVKIGCINSVCLIWMPDIIKLFSKEFPQINIEVYQGSYSDVIEWIKNGVIDIGILSNSVHKNLPFIPLYEDPLCCITKKNYMPKGTKSITPSDLINKPFIIQQNSCDTDIVNFLNKYSLNIQANCHILDDQSCIAMAECGMGILILPMLLVKSLKKNIDVFPISPTQKRILGISCLDENFLSPAAIALIDVIKSFIKDIPGSLV